MKAACVLFLRAKARFPAADDAARPHSLSTIECPGIKALYNAFYSEKVKWLHSWFGVSPKHDLLTEHVLFNIGSPHGSKPLAMALHPSFSPAHIHIFVQYDFAHEHLLTDVDALETLATSILHGRHDLSSVDNPPTHAAPDASYIDAVHTEIMKLSGLSSVQSVLHADASTIKRWDHYARERLAQFLGILAHAMTDDGSNNQACRAFRQAAALVECNGEQTQAYHFLSFALDAARNGASIDTIYALIDQIGHVTGDGTCLTMGQRAAMHSSVGALFAAFGDKKGSSVLYDYAQDCFKAAIASGEVTRGIDLPSHEAMNLQRAARLIGTRWRSTTCLTNGLARLNAAREVLQGISASQVVGRIELTRVCLFAFQEDWERGYAHMKGDAARDFLECRGWARGGAWADEAYLLQKLGEHDQSLALAERAFLLLKRSDYHVPSEIDAGAVLYRPDWILGPKHALVRRFGPLSQRVAGALDASRIRSAVTWLA